VVGLAGFRHCLSGLLVRKMAVLQGFEDEGGREKKDEAEECM